MIKASELVRGKCKACEGGATPLTDEQCQRLLSVLPGWELRPGTPRELVRTLSFRDYYETMAFVNALAWVSHRENHHPDLEVGYNKVTMRYSTHAVGGLSENDFICAAKIDALC